MPASSPGSARPASTGAASTRRVGAATVAVGTDVQPIDVDLMFLVNQAGYALTAEMATALAEIKINPREFCVLSHALKGDLTQIALAELSALDKTTMVVTLDRSSVTTMVVLSSAESSASAICVRSPLSAWESTQNSRGLILISARAVAISAVKAYPA